MGEAKNPYLKFVPLTKFGLWDVKRYTHKVNLNFDNIISLSEILTPYKRNVTKDEMMKNKWQIIAKINFSGELYLRKFEEIHSYKGNLNVVPENAIIYSKINAKHGCIYYNEVGKSPFGVSSEYPTFTFDETKVNGYFLQKLLRSNAFKQLLSAKSSGISKARVKQDVFLNIQIPLPTISEQEKIVKAYNDRITEVQQLDNQASNLATEIERYLFKELGYENKTTKSKKDKFLQIISYSSLDKWGVEQNLLPSKPTIKNNFEIKKIRELCTVSSGGTPTRTRSEYYNGSIPWIKTGEVINDIIYDTEEKITIDGINNSSARIYPKDSLIIAMYGQGLTRGRTAKLGIDASTNQACAVLFNIDNSTVLTDFLWVYLMGEYHRLREMASGNSQPNLNAQMIKDYSVIIPPISKQQEIVEEISKIKENSKENKIKARTIKLQANQDFEKAIFN